jgi:hypothetical protein
MSEELDSDGSYDEKDGERKETTGGAGCNGSVKGMSKGHWSKEEVRIFFIF